MPALNMAPCSIEAKPDLATQAMADAMLAS
jgi:hypothetical protein